jgi:hypothetical protein
MFLSVLFLSAILVSFLVYDIQAVCKVSDIIESGIGRFHFAFVIIFLSSFSFWLAPYFLRDEGLRRVAKLQTSAPPLSHLLVLRIAIDGGHRRALETGSAIALGFWQQQPSSPRGRIRRVGVMFYTL